MTLPPRLRGIFAMILGMGGFAASDTCTKLALDGMQVSELIALRGITSVTLCLLLIAMMRQYRLLTMALNPWLIGRGIFEVVGSFMFTFAIFRMPLADVTAIVQIAPLIVLAGSALLYGDKLGGIRLAVVMLGLCGALLVAQPGSSAASPYAILGFLVAFAAASRDLLTRRVSANVPVLVAALVVVTCLTLAGSIMTLAVAPLAVPPAEFLIFAVAAGLLYVAGHVGLFIAYKTAPAQTIAPFMYALMVWAGLSGVVVFGDIPNILAITGMALILLAGLSIIFLDGRATIK